MSGNSSGPTDGVLPVALTPEAVAGTGGVLSDGLSAWDEGWVGRAAAVSVGPLCPSVPDQSRRELVVPTAMRLNPAATAAGEAISGTASAAASRRRGGTAAGGAALALNGTTSILGKRMGAASAPAAAILPRRAQPTVSYGSGLDATKTANRASNSRRQTGHSYTLLIYRSQRTA